MNANEEMLLEMDYKSNMSRQERQRRAYEEAERNGRTVDLQGYIGSDGSLRSSR